MRFVIYSSLMCLSSDSAIQFCGILDVIVYCPVSSIIAIRMLYWFLCLVFGAFPISLWSGLAQDSRREGNVGEMAMIQIRDVSGASI